MRILLVEDDEMLGDATRQGMKQDGYAVDWVNDKKEASAALLTHRYDVIVLDIGLPDGSGLTLLSTLRATASKVPVIILTAFDTVEDRVKGLDLGADDYLVKPFDIHELCARIRSVYRRSIDQPSPLIKYQNIVLDPASRTITENNLPVELGAKEYLIIQTLIEKTGRVFSKQELEECLYDWGEDIASNTIEVHIHRIRKKFKHHFIQNKRGIGYFVPTSAE